jgi:GT2 family glycosyltransferase
MSAPHYQTTEELEEFAQKVKKGAVRQFRPVNDLSGFCMLIDRQVIDKIGMLDERFGIGNYEDQDFCRRAQSAGFKLLIANEVYVHHFGSRAFVENDFEYYKILEENRRKFERKWEAVPV